MEHDLGQIKMHTAGLVYSRADKVLRNIIDNLLKESSLSLSEWLLLGVIEDSPKTGIKLTNIAESLGVSQPQVTALMTKAVKQGLVRQRVGKHDRRNRTAVLTIKGKRLLDSIEENVQAFMKIWLSEIPAEQLKTYSETVIRVANYHKFIE